MSAKKVKKVHTPQWHFPLEKKNFVIIAIGIGVIIFGFLLMSLGINNDPAALPSGTWNNVFSISIAPIILVIGYCVIIPYGIIKTFSKKNTTAE